MTHAPGRSRGFVLYPLLLALLCVGLLPVTLLRAQEPAAPAGSFLFAGTTDSSAFPAVSIDVFAVDPAGLPLQGLGAGAFALVENDQPVDPARVSVVDQSALPLDLVLILDRSTDEPSWASTQTAAFNLIEQLRPGDEVALLSFADTVNVLAAPTENIGQARAALVGATPGGTENALGQAIAQGLDVLGPQEDRRRALVVVTDGPNTVDVENEQLSTGALTEDARRRGAAIQVLGYGPAASIPDVAQLATATGGRATITTVASDLTAHAQAIPSMLRQGYTLGYDSILPADGARGTLDIAFAGVPAVTPIERDFVAETGPVLVTITTPPDGDTVSGPVVIGLSAQAPAPVRGVTFALDDGTVITSTTGPVSGIIWDSSGATPGHRQVSVTVQDTAGNVGTDAVDLTVRPPLSLVVFAPQEKVPVGATAVVTAIVDSAFPNPVVELFVGRTQVGMKSGAVNPVVFEVPTTGMDPGSYGIYVRATNANGYTVADSDGVLTILPPPVTVNRTAAVAYARTQAWLVRSWQWMALLFVVAVGLVLLIWLWRRWRAARQRRAAARATAPAHLTPHVRMLLTNTGNTRTRYRLQARDSANDLRFTFLINGIALQGPTVAQAARPVAAANGVSATTPAPATKPAAANGSPVPAGAAVAAQNAGQAAGLATQLFAGLGQLLPGAAGESARRAAGTMRAGQGAVARVDYKVKDTVGDVQEIKAVSGKAVGAQPAKAAPAKPPAKAPSAAFALQTPAGAPAAATVPVVWVLTPPIAPGETVGIDIHVAPQRRLGRNKQVQFTVLSAPLDLENAPPAADEVSVRLGSAR